MWGPIIGAAIGGGLSFLGGRERNRAALAAAREQMAFQERMFKTRYQNTMADMRAAGLNPILAYQQGGGSAPGGSSYNPINVGSEAVTGAVAGANSALAARRQDQELKNMKAEERYKDQLNKTEIFKQVNIQADSHKKETDRKLGEQQIRNLVRQYGILGADLASANALERLYRANPGLREIEAIRRSLGLGGALGRAGGYLRRR